MRAIGSVIAITAVTALVVALSGPTASAKTALQISPQSGPPGTVVRVQGIGGFEPGHEARIALVRAPSHELPFTVASEESLPPSLPLGTASPSANYEIDSVVTMPSPSELAETFGETDADYTVVAIGKNSQIKGVFLARADFTLTGLIPPRAGVPSASHDAHLPVRALLASLGLAAGAVLTVWRIRHPIQEDAHGNDTDGGPDGP
jgi:hypothetical protein